MFFHLKNAITICVATACLISSGSAIAQTQSDSPEFSRRMAALQQARQRTSTTTVVTQQPAAQTAPRIARASATTSRSNQVRTAQLGSATRSFAPTGGFVPQHFSSPSMAGTIIDGGSPIVQGGIINGGQVINQSPIVGSQVIGSSIAGNEVMMGESYGGVVTEGYSNAGGGCDCGGGNCGGGGCDSGSCGGGCGDVGESYFADDCCGRGGCPEGGPCFLNHFGKIFSRAEYFGGFTAFRSNLQTGLDGSNELFDDSSHGVYGGFNIGLPLCRLSCGLFSGQFGVRTVNTNFGGAEFTDDDRNQIFMTAGFFRRVDYGLQLGVVADILREEWFSDVDLVQIRGEIGYVWQGGTSLGFRFASNAQDDETEGEFNNVYFGNNLVTTNDWYRFFMRHEVARGGYGEIFGGWTDNQQGIIGLDFDFPITDRIAFQSGFTYYMSDEELPTDQGFLGGDPNDSFNVFVGFSLRPNGRKYYQNYERPLFDVADNGTMMMYRQ